MNQRLNNQVAIVTGAGSGIGAGIAKDMAAEGAVVIVNFPFASVKDEAVAVQDDIIHAGGKAELFQTDVSKEAQVMDMFSYVIKKYGTEDILVNNAGVQNED